MSVDAYAGILVSLLILKAGFELLCDTVSNLIGRPGEHELQLRIMHEYKVTMVGEVEKIENGKSPRITAAGP